MSVTEVEARRQLMEACHKVYQSGLVSGSGGNLSLRWENSVLVTPTGRSLGAVTAEELVLLAMDGSVLSPGKPSMEWAIHLDTMRARPDINAVLHVHPPYSVAVSCLSDLDPHMALPIYTPGFGVYVGRLPLVPFHMSGSDELAAACVDQLTRHNAVMMANHGIVALAGTLQGAIDVAEEIEANARLHLILNGRGKALPPELFDPGSSRA